MAQISRVGRIWWRNLRRGVTPSLYWKLDHIHSPILKNIEFRTRDQTFSAGFMTDFACLFPFCSSIRVCNSIPVYQYLLNHGSFGISTNACICFSTFEDGDGGLVSSFYRWIGSQGTFPTFSLSLIVNWWKFLSTLFHQFIFDTDIYEKSGHLHNDNFDREIQGVPKKITFLKFILGPVGPLTGITLHHFGTT